jgi:hypothetical protein
MFRYGRASPRSGSGCRAPLSWNPDAEYFAVANVIFFRDTGKVRAKGRHSGTLRPIEPTSGPGDFAAMRCSGTVSSADRSQEWARSQLRSRSTAWRLARRARSRRSDLPQKAGNRPILDGELPSTRAMNRKFIHGDLDPGSPDRRQVMVHCGERVVSSPHRHSYRQELSPSQKVSTLTKITYTGRNGG